MSMDYRGSGLPGILRPLKVSTGYLRVELQTGFESKPFYIHRLVMLAFVAPPVAGMQVNHIDGNKANNVRSNLEYCTCSENHKHAFRTGLRKQPKAHEVLQ